MTLLQAQAQAQLLANKHSIPYVVVNFAGAYKVLSQNWAHSLSYTPVSIYRPRLIETVAIGQ